MANGLAGEDFIPCVLHMEMRVNEKLFWSLLSVGMDWHLDGDSSARTMYVSVVNDCRNSDIFGDRAKGRRGQWKLPLKDSDKQVEPKSMSGMTSRKCVVGLNKLIDTIFSAQLDEKSLTPQCTRAQNEDPQQKWLSLASTCVPMMEQLHRHEG